MKKPTILVVDDSQVIRARVREMLSPEDFNVLEATDGLEGLALLDRQRPSLIMLDFLLPRLSGWEFFQRLQQDRDFKTIPLVVMSGRKEEVTDKIAEPFQDFEFVEKPFEQQQLFAAIQRALVKAKLQQAEPGQSAVNSSNDDPSAGTQAEVVTLKTKMGQMQTEINSLKKAVSQLAVFIKHKLR